MQVIFLIILLLLVALCSFSGVMVFINYRIVIIPKELKRKH